MPVERPSVKQPIDKTTAGLYERDREPLTDFGKQGRFHTTCEAIRTALDSVGAYGLTSELAADEAHAEMERTESAV